MQDPTTMAPTPQPRLDALCLFAGALASAVCCLGLTWAVATQPAPAVWARAVTAAASTLGAWGDTTVPAAAFASRGTLEPIAPSF